MNLSLILLCIYPQTNVVIYRIQDEAWGPLEMTVSSACIYHGGPVWAVIPSSTYDCMRSTAVCITPSDRLTSVFYLLEARNNRRDGALRIYLAFALSIATRSSVGVSGGGG